jgi:hypothetical protein
MLEELRLPVLQSLCKDPTRSVRRMSRCIVLAIPEIIFQRVLLDWLGMASVARLDLACRSKKLRPPFLLAAYKDNIYDVEAIGPLTEPFLLWSMARGVRVENVILDHASMNDPALLAEFLAHQGDHLRSLVIREERRDARYALLETATRCPLVESMYICCSLAGAAPWDHQLLQFTEKCRMVRKLFLSRVPVSAGCLEAALRNCSNLTQLTINGMPCSLPKGKVFPSLVYIHICNCSGVSDTTLLSLPDSCPKLQTLHVFRQDWLEYHITDVGVRALLTGCPLLRETDVEYADRISHELRLELVRRCDFTRFHMAGLWRGLDNSCLQEILRLSGCLTSLHVKSCEWLQDATLLVCAQHCPLLTDLTLTSCKAITTEGVVSLITGCGATLKSVTLSGCVQLGDEVVMAITDHCPRLEVLHCPAGVTDAALVKLAEGCPLLVEICLNHANISDPSVVTLASHCPRLNNVRFGPRSDITMDAVRALAESCPSLVHLQLPYRLRHHVLTELKLRRVKCRYQDDDEPNGEYVRNSNSNTSSEVQEPNRRSCWNRFCCVVSYTKVT